MLYYLKKYPLSLLIVGAVLFLSFCRLSPPQFDLFFSIDKVYHIFMYGGLSGMLWLEFLWNHRKESLPKRRGFIGAALLPIMMSGAIELSQEYLTTYRGGEWGDFLANVIGVSLATLIAWKLIRPWMQKRYGAREEK